MPQKDGVDARRTAKSRGDRPALSEDRSVVALFPEGESLDAIGLNDLPLVGRAGDQRGLEEGGIGLGVVATGVTYERRDRRTRASVGEPIEVADREGRRQGAARRRHHAQVDVAGLCARPHPPREDEEEYEAAVLERCSPTRVRPRGRASRRSDPCARTEDAGRRRAETPAGRTPRGRAAPRGRRAVNSTLRGGSLGPASDPALLAVSAVALGPPFCSRARSRGWGGLQNKLVAWYVQLRRGAALGAALVVIGALVRGTGAASAAVLVGLALDLRGHPRCVAANEGRTGTARAGPER